MIRLILVIFLFLLSLLNVFRAPLNILWYVSILTTEFFWIFLITVILLMIFHFGNPRFDLSINLIGVISLVFFSLPVAQALRISFSLNKDISTALDIPATQDKPFSFGKIFSGMNAREIEFQTISYNTRDSLAFDFYPSQNAKNRPCIIVIHGGSWGGGTKEQLPELNSLLAKSGYNVFTINYKLAPRFHFPAPLEDVAEVIKYLETNSAALHIDASKIVLLGRSAGSQIALTAAYSLNDPSIKAVISYYGPTDMVWGYSYPANPLVLDSRKIMEDYLGGTYKQVPKQYQLSSATEIVRAESVPTLIIQGKNDPLVAYEHCNRMDKKLNEKQVKHFVLRMPWATHGCDYTLNGPAGQLCTYATMKFLGVYLK